MAFISTISPLRSATYRSPSLDVRRNKLVNASVRSTRPARINMAAPVRTTEADTPKKQFLDRLKALGNLRLIGRNDAVIMESIATFDGLFYATIPTGEYANLIDSSINLDMHLLLEGFSGAKFQTGISRDSTKSTTYIIRLLGKDRSSVILSLFLQWEKTPTDISQERTEAWKTLKADYAADSEQFFFQE
ncbi:hypothetical protein FGB62_219g018 [Gracilaria domingensis]|nr:hypothetical protein FGB62_219g018 [Gracilaria domingensis]